MKVSTEQQEKYDFLITSIQDLIKVINDAEDKEERNLLLDEINNIYTTSLVELRDQTKILRQIINNEDVDVLETQKILIKEQILKEVNSFTQNNVVLFENILKFAKAADTDFGREILFDYFCEMYILTNDFNIDKAQENVLLIKEVIDNLSD